MRKLIIALLLGVLGAGLMASSASAALGIKSGSTKGPLVVAPQFRAGASYGGGNCNAQYPNAGDNGAGGICLFIPSLLDSSTKWKNNTGTLTIAGSPAAAGAPQGGAGLIVTFTASNFAKQTISGETVLSYFTQITGAQTDPKDPGLISGAILSVLNDPNNPIISQNAAVLTNNSNGPGVKATASVVCTDVDSNPCSDVSVSAALNKQWTLGFNDPFIAGGPYVASESYPARVAVMGGFSLTS